MKPCAVSVLALVLVASSALAGPKTRWRTSDGGFWWGDNPPAGSSPDGEDDEAPIAEIQVPRMQGNAEAARTNPSDAYDLGIVQDPARDKISREWTATERARIDAAITDDERDYVNTKRRLAAAKRTGSPDVGELTAHLESSEKQLAESRRKLSVLRGFVNRGYGGKPPDWWHE